jgi:hypothetical protein
MHLKSAYLPESPPPIPRLILNWPLRDMLRRAIPAAIILIVFMFQVRTLPPRYYWAGSDIGLYLTHARNIVIGRPYSETLFVFNAHASSESPKTYPPLYPVLLSPLYRVFGLNLQVFKLLNVVFFALAERQ